MMDILNTIQADTVILKIDVEGYECKVSTLIQYYYVIKGKKLGVDTTTHHQSSTGGYGNKLGLNWAKLSSNWNWDLIYSRFAVLHG